MDSAVVYYENYKPLADILTVALCFVFIILGRNAYISKTRSYRFLRHMIYVLIVAALSNVFSHMALSRPEDFHISLVYISRVIYYLGIYSILFLYILYLKEALGVSKKKSIVCMSLGTVFFFLGFVGEIVGITSKKGFYIDASGQAESGFPIFSITYLLFFSLILIMLFVYRDRIYKRVTLGIIETICVSILVMIMQQRHAQTSYTLATFIFPIYAIFYLLHSNPYDVEIGSLGEKAFDDYVAGIQGENDQRYFMSLYLKEFDGKGRKYPVEIQRTIRYFTVRFFKSATLFTVSGGHMILAVSVKKNPEYLASGQKMLEEFEKVYPIYNIDYKIVFCGTDERLKTGADYVQYIRYIHDKIEENTVIISHNSDIEDFLKYKKITDEIADIFNKGDIDDERVKVFCQPVKNLSKGIFDTAEALMRLELEDIGMVYPNVFIPIAEKKHYIYMLSKIILNKTCKKIKELNDRGYYIKRISVNFSIEDLRKKDFCETVEKIMADSGIRMSQIAIEITETQNEEDFELLLDKIWELKDTGIKFYLDDFGTGYSNFERIMRLPFDIVKFDRSLVIASGKDENYKHMVENLANLFSAVDYSVLYEGIENDEDEKRCSNMKAKYLQGFKYSRPVPIDNLAEFLIKNGEQ